MEILDAYRFYISMGDIDRVTWIGQLLSWLGARKYFS